MDKGRILHLLDGLASMAEDMTEAAERGDESMLLHLVEGLKMVVSDLERTLVEGEKNVN